MEYRNELKYIVGNNNLTIFDYRLKNLLQLDTKAKSKLYNIRSIYFDSYNNKCFYENDSGINERFKIRIRMYNRSENDIKLEIKYKKNGLSKKEFCLISRQLCQKLIDGKLLDYQECTNKALKKLYIEQRVNCFKAKIIVEYDRVAYVDNVGNTRITFDTNIRASNSVNRFFEKNIFSRPIMETNKHILEIKYDDILPNYILKELELNKLKRVSFSKYYLARLEFKEEVL